MDRLLRLSGPLALWLGLAAPGCDGGTAALPPAGERFVEERLVSGIGHVCRLGLDGTTTCRWPRDVIAPARGVEDAVQVAAGGGDGGEHVCVRRSTGRVACWLTDPDAAPVEVPDVDDAIDVAGGTYEAALVRASGDVVLFWPGSGRLTTLPGADAVEVATSIGQTCVRRRDGSVACGRGEWRQIGSFTDALEIHVNTALGCALRATGNIVCWEPAAEPRTLAGVNDAVEMSIAEEQPCARRASDQVVCWPRPDSSAEPEVPAALDDAVELADVAGYAWMHCARRSTGEIVCWSGTGPAWETLVGL